MRSNQQFSITLPSEMARWVRLKLSVDWRRFHGGIHVSSDQANPDTVQFVLQLRSVAQS